MAHLSALPLRRPPATPCRQILLAIGIIEHQSEWKIKPHYMAEGGAPGVLKGLKSFWDPIGFTSKLDAKKLERQRLSELKNGAKPRDTPLRRNSYVSMCADLLSLVVYACIAWLPAWHMHL
jgi:hypothetical protein